ncbi:MAG: DNA repair protein RecN, partial [Erysipelotrichaceae bacterium]
MLKNLYVKDYVIIDEINLDFDQGFLAFTGETGAGKSLIIDAISLLCGEKSNSSIIRLGQDKAIIQGVFSFKDDSLAKTLLKEYGFDDEEEYLFLREISANKSVFKINFRPVTLSIMKDILLTSVDIHSQHDIQYLLNNKYHLQLLDQFINDPLKEQVSNAYHEYKVHYDQLMYLQNKKFSISELEYLQTCRLEIENVNILENEIDEINDKLKLIKNSEKISLKLSNSLNIFNMSVVDNYFQAIKELNTLDLPVVEQLWSNYYQLEELVTQLNNDQKDLDFDEQTINEINQRSYDINKIRRKYGETYPLIMDKYHQICEEIDQIENSSMIIDELIKKVDVLKENFIVFASKYHDIRVEKALELEHLIKKHLNDLELNNANFKVSFKEIDGNSNGIDQVEFLLSTNLNAPLSPLSKIASGGELSRIMLGLKTVFTKLAKIETVIFDEIDSGVSGSSALAIGKKMLEIACDTQVIAITHLSQVAAYSNLHYHVSKLNK